MNARSRNTRAILANVLVCLVVVLPLLIEPLAAWAAPVAIPGRCSGETIVLITEEVSGSPILTIENPQISNAGSTGCDVSGQMRIQLAGNNVGSIPISGQVDYANAFRSTSIGAFELQIAGLTLKVGVDGSSFVGGKLLLTWPKIKIPDAWGGLEAPVPQTFTVDRWGLTVDTFPLPSIETKSLVLILRGKLGLGSTGYKIMAHGTLLLPEIGSIKTCVIEAYVTLQVNAAGNLVMEIETVDRGRTASLAAHRSEVALPAGQAALIPASMPLQSSDLPLPNSLSDEAWQQLRDAGATPADQAQAVEPATMSGTDGRVAEPAGDWGWAEGSQDAGGSLITVSFEGQSPLAATGAEALPSLALPEPADTLTDWGSLVISATAECADGIPIGTTGFELTGVRATIELLPTHEKVTLGVTIESTLALGPISLLSMDGDAEFQWSPEFAASIEAVVKLLSMFEVAGGRISISETDGLRLAVWWDPLWPPVRADFALHAWLTTVESCTDWNTLCYDHFPLPPTCTSSCSDWDTQTKFHFTGSAACEIGFEKGELWSSDILPYPCYCRWCWKWWGGYPCCSLCWVSIDIPPFDMWLAGAGAQFGEFTGDRWGLKGTVSFLGYTTGFYVDHEGTLDFGDVSSYKLVDAEQLLAARDAWRAATLANGPQASFTGDDTFSFLSDDHTQVHFDLPLVDDSSVQLMGVTDLITSAQVISKTDTIFTVKADVPLRVTLTSPDGHEITPENYGTHPGDYVVEYTRTMTNELLTGGAVDPDQARWRFIPASNAAAMRSVDVKLDGAVVFSGVSLDDEKVMAYVDIPTGTHTVEVLPEGSTWVAASTPFEVVAGTDYTVLAAGDTAAEVLVLEDDNTQPITGTARVRVVNAAPTADPLDAAAADPRDTTLDGLSFQDVTYGAASDYQVVPAGAYSLTLASATLEPSLAISLTGDSSAGLFGDKVASAGDVNGDGYDDVLVGDNAEDGDRGSAYLFLGTPGKPAETPAWTKTGENEGDKFGISVAGAGDVNADGYDDVLVGAYGYDSSQGKAYLYLGSAGGLAADPAWTDIGENAGDMFGGAVASAGDVDGDGYDDVLVGADLCDYSPQSPDAGRVYLYSGSSDSVPLSAAWTVAGEYSGDHFGASLAGAGDVNGDGYDDVIVGAYGRDRTYEDQGKVYVYHGSASGMGYNDRLADWAPIGEGASSQFGISVAGAGDVNADGYDDVVIGAYGYPFIVEDGPSYQGRAYLYQGASDRLSDMPDWSATGGAAGDRFGASVAGAGDVDRDGYDDVLVGAYGYPGGTERGQAILFHGSADGLSAPGWTATGSLNTTRSGHTATLLPDGRVLVAAGEGEPGTLSSAELYDPATGLWTATGSLHAARRDHTATLLPDGRVLVAGGQVSEADLASAELYDPSTGTWTPTGSMNTARNGHTATLLPDGRVLVVGGMPELYDPATGSWSYTSNPIVIRRGHTATLLPDGRVLVAGGLGGGYLASAELYDPATGLWALSGSLNTARYLHSATLLPGGRVLVAGGYNDSAGYYLASAELYDPVAGSWTSTGSLNAGRSSHTATLLPGGRVLVAGGDGFARYLASAELYDPATGLWAPAGSLNTGRSHHTATLLPNGRVLVAGGSNYDAGGYLVSTELYSPVWTATGASDGNQFGISVAGAGDTNRDGHGDLIIGAPGMQSRAHLYYGDTGLFPTQLTVPDRDVQTLVVSHVDGSPDPLALLQVRDASSEEVYGVVTSTLYVVDQAITGTWTVNLIGDTEGANLAVSAVAAPNPPILDQLTVDASDLANTLVTYRLLSDYQPVTMHMFANDGPLTTTTTITLPATVNSTSAVTRTEVVTLYQGIEVATIPITGTLAVKNALITTTLDLSFLESGAYKLWVRVEDGVSPPVQGYVWGVDTYTSGELPTSWNRVRIAATDYDAGRQLAGAAVIAIDHSDSWADTWTATMNTEITPEGLYVEYTPYDHPDVDGYLLELTGAGQTHVMTTGNTIYFHYDENEEPVGDPVHYATFEGLSPQQSYSLRIAALDLDSGRSSWSQAQAFTVPVGELTLSALEPAITLPALEELVTATLILTMSEDLFSDVHLSLESYQLPPGIALKGITYEPLGSAGTTASLLPWEGIPAPARLAPSLVALSAEGATNASTTLLARAALTVTLDVPAATYVLPFVAYSGLLERRAEVRLQVGAPQEVLVPADATQPIVLHAYLPLPSCATAIDVTVPPDAFNTAAYVGFWQSSLNVDDWRGMPFAGSHFTLTARDEGGTPLQPLVPLGLELRYDPLCLGGLYEEGLHLRSWLDQAGWATAGIACTPDPAANRLACSLPKVGEMAMFEPALLYLPIVLKDS
jgi:hypothetical protein